MGCSPGPRCASGQRGPTRPARKTVPRGDCAARAGVITAAPRRAGGGVAAGAAAANPPAPWESGGGEGDGGRGGREGAGGKQEKGRRGGARGAEGGRKGARRPAVGPVRGVPRARGWRGGRGRYADRAALPGPSALAVRGGMAGPSRRGALLFAVLTPRPRAPHPKTGRVQSADGRRAGA